MLISMFRLTANRLQKFRIILLLFMTMGASFGVPSVKAEIDERIVSQIFHNVIVSGKRVEFELNNSYTSVDVKCQLADPDDVNWEMSVRDIKAADMPIVRKSLTGNMFEVTNLFPGREYLCKVKSEIVRFMTDGPPRKVVATTGIEIEDPKPIIIQTVKIFKKGFNPETKAYEVTFEPDQLKMHQEYALRCRDRAAYESGFLLDLKVYYAYLRDFDKNSEQELISIPDLAPGAVYQCQLFLRSLMGESHIIWKQSPQDSFALNDDYELVAVTNDNPEEEQEVEMIDPFQDLQLVARRRIMKFSLNEQTFQKLSGRTRVIYQFYDSQRERTRTVRRRITARELEKGMLMPYLADDADSARLWIKDPNFSSHNVKYQIQKDSESFEKEEDEGDDDA